MDYSKYDIATLKVLIDSTFSCMKNKKYKIWINHSNKLMLQCYEGKEFYGYEYEVDLDKKTMTLVII